MTLRLVAARDRLLDELAELLLDQLRVLLAHGLAQHVGFGERDAGQHLRDAHHLLLVGDDAVGGLEDRLELGQRVRHRLLAALAPLVDAVHPGVERAGAHERARGDEIVEPVAAHARAACRSRAATRTGTRRRCDRRGASDRSPGRRVGASSRSGRVPRALLDRLQRVVDDRERRQAEEVHLEHARLLERVHVVLRDDRRVSSSPAAGALRRLRADGHVLVERAGRDHDAGRVHAGVARQPFERDRVVEQLAIALVVLVELAPPRAIFSTASFTVSEKFGWFGISFASASVSAGVKPSVAADVLDRRARLQRPERHDLADRIPCRTSRRTYSITSPRRSKQKSTSMSGIDTRSGIQEALEEQVVRRAGQTSVMPERVARRASRRPSRGPGPPGSRDRAPPG